MKLCIGSDHAGFFLKASVISLLSKNTDIKLEDFGTETNEKSVDYVDYAEKVSGAVSKGICDRGILVCGSGIGMSIVANRFPGVRAALCHDMKTAELSRRHNDSNIIVLGERLLDSDMMACIINKWLETPFDAGRHSKRLEKIKVIEEKLYKR